MNLPALATPMSEIASGKGSLKIGAPASSRFARTSTSSRRPAGFMAMGGVCPDANLIQRLSAPTWAGRRKVSPTGKGWVRVEARRAFGGDSLSGSPWLVQKDGGPSGRPSACWILPVGEGGRGKLIAFPAGRAEKVFPRRHSACSRERDLAKVQLLRYCDG